MDRECQARGKARTLGLGSLLSVGAPGLWRALMERSLRGLARGEIYAEPIAERESD